MSESLDDGEPEHASRRRRRSSVEREHDHPELFQMDSDMPAPIAALTKRRGSVECEVPSVEEDDENTNSTLSIRIARAESPAEDLDETLLNSSGAPADLSLYRTRQAPCGSGLSVADFDLLSLVGRGAYGKVFLVRRKTNGRQYAMKVVRKCEAIRKNVVQNMRAERDVLEAVRHPFIVNLRFAFQTHSKLYLCMDFVSGGELFSRLAASRDHAVPIKDARFYAAELVLALEHLHKLDIIYRDLKPENIMLSSDGHVVLCDFGFAKENVPLNDQGTRSFCGTCEYLAPEIVQYAGHGKGSDWWALGALLYEMITGSTPFASNNRKKTLENILTAPLKLPKYLDGPTKSVLTELLRRPVNKRLGCGPTGATAIKKHPFFAGIDWVALGRKAVPPPFIPAPLAASDDTTHFDAKFTSERAVDTPLSPSQMASLLHGAGISPATFHTADETFAGFSYARDHTPAPSPALRAMGGPSIAPSPALRAVSTGSLLSSISPRPIMAGAGGPPLHPHHQWPMPDTLELPPHSAAASSSSTAAATASSFATVAVNKPHDPDAWPETDSATLTVLAATKATNRTQAAAAKAAAAEAPASAPAPVAVANGVRKPKAVKVDAVKASAATSTNGLPAAAAPALVTARAPPTSKLSQQLADRKQQNGAPAVAVQNGTVPQVASAPSSAAVAAPNGGAPSLGIRMLGDAKPALASALKAPRLSAAAPAFVPGGFAPSASVASMAVAVPTSARRGNPKQQQPMQHAAAAASSNAPHSARNGSAAYHPMEEKKQQVHAAASASSHAAHAVAAASVAGAFAQPKSALPAAQRIVVAASTHQRPQQQHPHQQQQQPQQNSVGPARWGVKPTSAAPPSKPFAAAPTSFAAAPPPSLVATEYPSLAPAPGNKAAAPPSAWAAR